jgi:hypothetical protein
MKILECALRDVRYYSKCDFDKTPVDICRENSNKIPIDYLSVGYRVRPLIGYLRKCFLLSGLSFGFYSSEKH